MWLKITSVYAVVESGRHALFQDADVVWFRDPIAHAAPRRRNLGGRRSPFGPSFRRDELGLTLAALDYGRRPGSNAGEASPIRPMRSRRGPRGPARRHGMSTAHPRRRRDSSPRHVHVAPASAAYPRTSLAGTLRPSRIPRSTRSSWTTARGPRATRPSTRTRASILSAQTYGRSTSCSAWSWPTTWCWRSGRTSTRSSCFYWSTWPSTDARAGPSVRRQDAAAARGVTATPPRRCRCDAVPPTRHRRDATTATPRRRRNDAAAATP